MSAYRDAEAEVKLPARVRLTTALLVCLALAFSGYVGGWNVGHGKDPCRDQIKLMSSNGNTEVKCDSPEAKGEMVRESGWIYLSCVCKR